MKQAKKNTKKSHHLGNRYTQFDSIGFIFEPFRPSYNRGQERDNYRNKRPSYNDSHQNRDRRDDGMKTLH